MLGIVLPSLHNRLLSSLLKLGVLGLSLDSSNLPTEMIIVCRRTGHARVLAGVLCDFGLPCRLARKLLESCEEIAHCANSQWHRRCVLGGINTRQCVCMF